MQNNNKFTNFSIPTFRYFSLKKSLKKSTINKTIFYWHYKDVLKDIFSDGLDAAYEDCSLFFSSPYEFFLLNNKEENTENFIYFEKQLRENPAELFDSLYFDLFRERIYQNRLLPKIIKPPEGGFYYH